MHKLGLRFIIDVSGTPYGKVIIGLLSLYPDRVNEILKEFKKVYPEVYRSKKKGTTLTESTLFNILEMLNKYNCKMVAIEFNNKDWNYYKEKYGHLVHFNEKIFSILYFMALKEIAFTNYKYSVTICKENFMDISKVIESCKRLAKANYYNFDFEISYAKISDVIKLADCIAAAPRKINRQRLKKIIKLKILSGELSNRHLNKVFRLDKK